MRLFFGIELENDIRNYIHNVIQELNINYNGIKWVEKENLHITLEFLGETDINDMNNIIESIEKISFPTFNIDLNSIGGFPYLDKARVLWIGLKEHKIELMNLYKKLHFTCKNVKSNLSDRPYHPHVTIARIKRPLNNHNIEKINKYKSKNFGQMIVNKITLYKSELRKDGPVYKIIKNFHSKNVN
jgi:2'-5' RNA ligase